MSKKIFKFPYYYFQSQIYSKDTIPKDNLSLIHIAAYFDSLECLIYLERTVKIDLLTTTLSNYNVLHYACEGNAIEVAEYILQKYPFLAQKETQTELQYLYLAVFGNSPSILELLFKKGANLKGPATSANQPITSAIKKKHVKCLEILLKHTTKSLENTELTSIMLSIQFGHTAAVPLLIEAGADPTARTSDNKTALSINCFTTCDVDTTRVLCDAMVDIDIPPNIACEAAVHWLCRSANPEIAAIMLEKNIDVNRFDGKGLPGPFYLVDFCPDDNALKIMEMLYQHGLQLDLRYSEKHNTILGYFLQAMNRYPKVIDWLISKGANVDLPFYSPLQQTTIREKLLSSMDYQDICKKYSL